MPPSSTIVLARKPRELPPSPPAPVFANPRRSAPVEPGALVEALQRGRPGMAAVDVYEREPVRDEPLLRLPNVVASPHLGFVEHTSYETLFGGAFDNVVAFADGQPRNLVNAAALAAR